jgi:DeoR/GlpR family transcriptional regulator of sugar metabolism
LAFIERHQEILRILSKLKKVSVQTLTERLGVSEVTIRKDLSFLGAQGRLMRTHGGAVLAEDRDYLHTLQLRIGENVAEKRAIARQARRLIREDDTIYLDAGTTCYLLAREIREMSLRVVTNSLNVLMELSTGPQITLFSLGGSFRPDAGSFIGPQAVEALGNFQIETCFLGATGISRAGAFSSQNIIEAQLKRSVLQASQRSVVMADHTKFSVNAFSIFAKAEEVDILITDEGLREAELLRALGIEVILAPAAAAA